MAEASGTPSNVEGKTSGLTEAASSQGPGLFRPVASYWHLLAVLIAQGALAYRGRALTLQLHGAALDRVALYQRTMLLEWLLLGLVLAGVWWQESSVFSVLGERWRSPGRFFRDFGIGLAFLMVPIVMGSIAGSLLGHGNDAAARRILPQGGVETWYWVALSISAGICEEAIYRGYLQRQFMALTRNVPAGILFSATLFGAAHSYQGVRLAVQIGILGALSGMLAYWCKSVRPGMIAHILQDLMGGLAHSHG